MTAGRDHDGRSAQSREARSGEPRQLPLVALTPALQRGADLGRLVAGEGLGGRRKSAEADDLEPAPQRGVDGQASSSS
jgi:hypothetical protein